MNELHLLLASSIGVIVGFLVGIIVGRAIATPEENDGGFNGTYHAYGPLGMRVLGTEASNPSTSWSLLQKKLNESRASLKAQGFAVKRAD